MKCTADFKKKLTSLIHISEVAEIKVANSREKFNSVKLFRREMYKYVTHVIPCFLSVLILTVFYVGVIKDCAQ